jgi:iron complex transport system substrate-binding protein
VLGSLAVVVSLPASAPTARASGGASGIDYPIRLVDDEGTGVTLERRPERVISLSPAITETVFALGAGDRLVGGTDYDDVPPEAAALPDVATFTGVVMEQVVALEPDLVIAAGNEFTPSDDIARLRELGFPVIVVYAETVDEVLADIRLIGDAVGRPEEAARLAADMAADIGTVTAAVAETGSRPRTFYEIGWEPEIYGPAPGSFIADMVELAGGEAITTGDPAVFSMALERLVEADPEVIVLGDAIYGVCPETVHARPGWGGMTAVREGAIRPVDDIVVTRPGPRLPEGLAALAGAIHPEVSLTGFPPGRPICEASGS